MSELRFSNWRRGKPSTAQTGAPAALIQAPGQILSWLVSSPYLHLAPIVARIETKENPDARAGVFRSEDERKIPINCRY